MSSPVVPESAGLLSHSLYLIIEITSFRLASLYLVYHVFILLLNSSQQRLVGMHVVD